MLREEAYRSGGWLTQILLEQHSYAITILQNFILSMLLLILFIPSLYFLILISLFSLFLLLYLVIYLNIYYLIDYNESSLHFTIY